MSGKHDNDAERQREAQAALDRVVSESETVGTSSFARVANRARSHMAADDKQDENDALELWGTRIGRGAALVFAIALVGYLLKLFEL